MPNYYWVNQGATYNEELQAGCLWAPNTDVNGSKLSHWETMDQLIPGDIVFTYANTNLRGYAVVTAASAPMLKPFASGAPYSPAQGGRIVFCNYTTANPPVAFNVISAVPGLITLLSGGSNPVMTKVGKVSQKYLCPVLPAAASQLLALLAAGGMPAALAPPAIAPIGPTTVKALVDARLGQGKFRSDLIAAFGGACAITGLNVLPLLRASHIKPWAKGSNADRLDPANGLLLAAGVDAAFDCGYVGFDPLKNGTLVIKAGFAGQIENLGIPATAQVPAAYLNPARAAYLNYHMQLHKL